MPLRAAHKTKAPGFAGGYLLDHLKGCDGVEDARFTPGRNHLMLIDYDRDQLHSKDVLGYVREAHTMAELVGP